MLLSELEPGQDAIVDSVGGSGAIRRHLLDMGLTPNALITLQKVAPMGDPIQITVRGFELTLRLEEANNVQVTLSDKPAALHKSQHIHQDIAHPRSRRTFWSRRLQTPHPKGNRQNRPLNLRSGRKPKLRQNHLVQSANRSQSACRQLPWRYRRQERRHYSQPLRSHCDRLAWSLLAFSVLK